MSVVCERAQVCAVGKFVLLGHLERCGAHGMRVPLLTLARFAEYFLKRNTLTPAGISIHHTSSRPPLLTISGGLGERVNGTGRAPGGLAIRWL